MKTRILRVVTTLLGPGLLAAAVWILHRELQAYSFKDVISYLHALPGSRLALCLSLTALSYLVMTGYDLLALKYVRHPLPYAKIAAASFVSYAFSNNIGLSMLAGGSVRYRLYSSWGLSAMEVTQVVAFCTLSLWLGFLTLGGLVFLMEARIVPDALHVPFSSFHFLGVLFLILVSAYLFLNLVRRRPFRIGGWEFHLPSSRLLLPQIFIAFLDWALAGFILFLLLPESPGLHGFDFMAVYLFAQMMGLISQLPGGLGVFETVVVMLISPTLPAAQVVGALFAYRGIYYFLPLLLAAALLAAQEGLRRRSAFQRLFHVLGRGASILMPQMLALTTFAGGAVLLFSGATPAVIWRLAWLNTIFPLPVIEISHFLGSLVGVALLLLARGLQRRVDVAYALAVSLLAAGIVVSLLKGFDYEEAMILSLMLGILIPCRRHFYRKGSLFVRRFQPGWFAAILAVLVCSTWLGLFAHKHVEYSDQLWWRFTLHGDAPRFLRALLGVFAVSLFFVLAKLLRPAPPKPLPPQDEALDRVYRIVLTAPDTTANLALLGDKLFFFSQEKTAFIMYRIQGRSWVSMGDPVGEQNELSELIWQFMETSDSYGGWPVFYETGPDHLPLYVDLGLTFLKIGEEARIPLGAFSLEGSARRGLRNTRNRLDKEGFFLEILPPDRVTNSLPELKAVSEAWLSRKNVREKGFSLGFFNESYLKRYPVAVVRKERKIVGFANLWMGAEKEEISVDLMRYHPDTPNGIMDYIFLGLMLHGKEEGYRWFNLGMAPLSGLEDRAHAPFWGRLGSFVFRHGEHFYNLQGLRQYKGKFNPEWRPKYLACPGGLSVPRVLASVASLIAGGIEGVVAK